ncbi:hypothetical protein CEXT_668661 [Caerostris extrusa]|uniref:Uncharacterized protein n=1 Tax=Caerostris extrusa TaxID=172846 RepID=A0AAV4T5Y3_CAEEX|nr:hypothetical protein CEXT_668661 [Caerostris extrusa]
MSLSGESPGGGGGYSYDRLFLDFLNVRQNESMIEWQLVFVVASNARRISVIVRANENSGCAPRDNSWEAAASQTSAWAPRHVRISNAGHVLPGNQSPLREINWKTPNAMHTHAPSDQKVVYVRPGKYLVTIKSV